MKKLLIEIDETTEAKINTAAKAAGVTTQQWLEQLIAEKIAPTWPNAIKALPETWQDIPFAEELRAAEGQSISREEF